jgi:hypothetical protein
MGLNDLMNEIKQDPGCLTTDETFEVKIVKNVITLVEDKNSEVKNQAAKWSSLLTPLSVILANDATVWVKSSKSYGRRRWKWWLIG